MAARSCCEDAARAVMARRRLKVKRRRPSSTSSLAKARRNLRQAGGKPGALAGPSRKRVAVAIRRKMESLRRLVVPGAVCGADGGSGERLDELLLHAAGYIMRLQMQVRVMHLMVHALNNPAED